MKEVVAAKFHPAPDSFASKEAVNAFISEMADAAKKGAARAGAPTDFDGQVIVTAEDKSVLFLFRWKSPVQDIAAQSVQDEMVKASSRLGATIGDVPAWVSGGAASG